ncbi:MAG TPA: lysylphosphatidylglycerol synthase transmembrane domain-containing protein [Methylomirabilota bacterium]|nr:lysylphosphatidylglycerol synthase transmembrane domain-containing protein [Methylomirabilota bacterium]
MIGAHNPAQAARARALIVLRWIAALVVLYLLIHFLPFAPLRAALSRVPGTRFLLALIAYLAAHTLGVAKWRMVVNTAGGELDFATSTQCYAGGLFGTLFLPSIIGGDVVRLAVGLRRSPRPASVLAGNIVDRSLDVAAQGALALTGLILLPGSLPPVAQAAARHLVTAFVVVLAILAVAVFLLRGVVFRKRSIRFRRKLAHFRYGLRSVVRRPHVLLVGWCMGIVVQGTFLFFNALLAVSCGLILPLRAWLFAWPLAKVAALVPVTQGGIGVREAALVALLAPFGAPGALVLAAGLVWEGVIISGGLFGGLVAFLLRRTREREESATG